MLRRITWIGPLLALTLTATAADLPDHDPARSLSGLTQHDGSPDAPGTTTGLWRQLVFELRRDAEATSDWPSSREVQRRAQAATDRDVVPVGVLASRYRNVRAERTGRVFAASALRPSVAQGRRIVFDADARWTVGDAVRPLDLDFGDGWQPFDDDDRLAHTFVRAGKATIRLRAELDGDIVEASFPVDVSPALAPAPHDTLMITASTPFDGAVASGRAYVYLAPGRTALQNPVVMVEGFDLDDTMDWDVLYDMLNQQNLLEDLRADGFDAVVLDFDSATEPIQRNAFVLTELLQQVNASVGPHRSSVLVGASMGGLVTRYALAWMEQQGLDHQVRTWISFDSPQRGAVIPLGLQHWLEFFQGDSESAAYLLSRLDTPAARQMLLQHHDSTSGTTAAADPLRASFTADLDAIGLPSCRRVAVANGSGAVADQGFAAGQQIIRYEYYSLLLDLKGNVWALPDGNQIRIFQGEQNLIWPLPDTYVNQDVAGTLPWDNAPGGWRASMAQMDTTSVPYGDIEALAHHHAFIPTISALDLDVTDPFHDVLGDPDLMTRTHFERVFVPAANEEHVTISAASAVWLKEEIAAGVVGTDDVVASMGSLQAWPNPFNPSTTFSFTMPTAGSVSLDVFDGRGRHIASLHDGRLDRGLHQLTWNGRTTSGPRAASGLYLARLLTPTSTSVIPVTLLE